jgi:nitrile hydratase beta subunit-like protein
VSATVSPRFRPGDSVLVADRSVEGHVRTPRYVRGKRGIVERICGAFRNPEQLARGDYAGAPRPLYRVRFVLLDLWAEYAGPPTDTVDVEIYEHWLEPAVDGA